MLSLFADDDANMVMNRLLRTPRYFDQVRMNDHPEEGPYNF